MGKKRKHLSHEEIWDDSALVNSWNDALEEYKLYHSIHAKGERVEDVIDDFANNGVEANGINEDLHDENEQEDGELEDGEWADDAETALPPDPSSEATLTGNNTSAERSGAQDAGADTEAAPSLSMPVPAPFPTQFQDEALKNLIISWYWSGYYTGFYQGQQQAQSYSNGNG